MLIKAVNTDNLVEWIELVREVESVIKDLVDDYAEFYREFYKYMQVAIKQYEAFMAVDRATKECMGIISFAKKNNSITFLLVSEKYRSKGVGTKLLECALNQLDNAKEIMAEVFRENYAYGVLARPLFREFGFIEYGNTLSDCGVPVSIMKILPDKVKTRGGSFHYNFASYMNWSGKETCPVCCNEPSPSDIVLIKEFEHSWLEVSIEAQGCLWGKCHLLCKKHYLELYEMSEEDLLNFMTDVQKAAKALKKVTGAVKINYEIHGNSVPHLHVHLFPRYIDDLFASAPIDYRITEPKAYRDEEEFQNFVEEMRRELERS